MVGSWFPRVETARVAERRSRMKRIGREEVSRLLGIASHDLRSPLAAIAAHSDNLLDNVYGEVRSEAKERIRKIRRIAMEASAAVEEILSLAGAADPAPCADLRQAVREVAASVRLRTRPRGVKVDVRLSRSLPRLDVARALVKSAVRNLVDNATKASPPRGRVSIEVRRGKGAVRIEVKDRGTRGSHPWRQDAGEEEYGSEGLGLGIVREIVEDQGGKVFACPRNGGGWTAGFVLPCRPVGRRSSSSKGPRIRRK